MNSILRKIHTTDELKEALERMDAAGEVSVQLIVKHNGVTWHKMMSTDDPVSAGEQICSEINRTLKFISNTMRGIIKDE